MRNRSKLLLTGLTAALVLAAAVSTASARNLSISEREFWASWTALTFSGGGSEIICPVILLGSFHRTSIAKTQGALIGTVYNADRGMCQGDGRATILKETLPWHVTFQSFTGELPTITGITILLVGASFRVEDGIPCLARTDLAEPAGGRVTLDARGQVTGLRALEEFQIDLDTPGFLCDLAGNARFSGTARVEAKDGRLIFVRLI